ncbi:unnamed protein product [Symbiodinium sp. CCMP2592]|nr:unnamed protein product [Symbiodinium sp. CCMP2592]
MDDAEPALDFAIVLAEPIPLKGPGSASRKDARGLYVRKFEYPGTLKTLSAPPKSAQDQAPEMAASIDALAMSTLGLSPAQQQMVLERARPPAGVPMAAKAKAAPVAAPVEPPCTPEPTVKAPTPLDTPPENREARPEAPKRMLNLSIDPEPSPAKPDVTAEAQTQLDTDMDRELLHHLDSAETLVLGQTQSLARIPTINSLDGEPMDDEDFELEAARAAAAKYQELLQKRQQKAEVAKKAAAEAAALEQAQKAQAEQAAQEQAQKAKAEQAAREQAQKAQAEQAAREQAQKAQAEQAALEQAQNAKRAALEQALAAHKAQVEQAALEQAQKAEAEKAALEKAKADQAALEQQQKAQAEQAALEEAQKAEAEKAAQRAALIQQTELMIQQAQKDDANRAAKEAQLELDQQAERQLRTQATDAALQADQYRITAERLAREADQARLVFLEASKKADAAVKARVDKTLEVEQAQQDAAERATKSVQVGFRDVGLLGEDDFELPVLSEAEQNKYKGFWNRLRSRSFDTLTLSCIEMFRASLKSQSKINPAFEVRASYTGSRIDIFDCWYCGDSGDDSEPNHIHCWYHGDSFDHSEPNHIHGLVESTANSGAVGTTPEASTAGIVTTEKQASPGPLQDLLRTLSSDPSTMEAIAKMLAEIKTASVPATPSPTTLSSPPPKASTAATPPPSAPAPPPVAPSPATVGPTTTELVPTRCNSASHPGEYKNFIRFCERHEHAGELKRLYYPWTEILDFHSGDLEKAKTFIEMRRRQAKGTSWDRNDPTVETFLYYGRDEISAELGCDPRFAASLMESFEKGNVIGQGGADLEATIMDEKNVGEFVLEALESQDALIKLIAAAPFVEAFKKHQRVASNLSGDTNWLDFWSQAKTEDWGRSHPVQSWDEASRATAYGITIHGDEGQSKRKKNVLVLSWSPVAVMQSDFFAYDEAGVNISLQQFQRDLACSLRQCASPDNGLGHTLHIIAGKGDWKWRAEWLMQSRHYMKVQSSTDGLCPRCLCTRDTWLDAQERFNAPADLQTARLTAVGDIPLKTVPGWQPEMEVPDLLHTLWTGTGRDLIGSLCLQIVEFSRSYTGSTYDERLRQLRRDMQTWCSENNIRPSTVEELSILDLIN